MKYAIQITGTPQPPSDMGPALQFTRAALKAGHRIVRVFFYQDGVHHAYPVAGAASARSPWADLAERHGLDLVCCVAACERRGLAPAAIGAGFRAGGLGQWVDACLAADRVISFRN